MVNEIPATLTATEETTETSAKEKEVETKETEKKKHVPKEGSKRWEELYYEKKETERKAQTLETQLAEKDADINAIKSEFEKTQKLLLDMQDEVDNLKPIPDPVEDPAGYKNYVTTMATKKARREYTPAKPAVETSIAPETPTQSGGPTVAFLEALDAMESSLHEDYDAASQIGLDAMKADPALKQMILSKRNPAKAWYEYGKKVMEGNKASYEAELDQGAFHESVKGDGVKTGEVKLSAEQLRVARVLGVDPKKYYANVIKLGL